MPAGTPFATPALLLGTEVEEALAEEEAAELELSAVELAPALEEAVIEVEAEAEVMVVMVVALLLDSEVVVLLGVALVLEVLEVEVVVVVASEEVVAASEEVLDAAEEVEAEPVAPPTVKVGEKLYSSASLSSMISMVYFWSATRSVGTCQV